MHKYFPVFIFLIFPGCFFSLSLFGQVNQTDSLSNLLNTATGLKKAEIELHLADIFRRVRPAEAIRFGEDALSISRAQKDKSIEFRALVLLSSISISTSPSSEIYKYYIEPARKLEKYVTDLSRKAEFFQNLASYYSLTGMIDSAEFYYMRSLESVMNTKNQSLESSVEGSIAGFYALKGRYEEALEFGMSSLKSAESTNEPILIALSLNRIADIYVLWRYYAFALDYLQKALIITEKAGLNTLNRQLFNSFGEIYKNLKQYEKAIDYYQKAIKCDEEMGGTGGVAIFLINIGECYNKSGKPEKAIPEIEKALKIFKVSNYTEGIARCNAELGVAFRDLKSFSKSAFYFNESQSLAKQINLIDLIISNYRDISNLYSLQGNVTKAFEYYKLFSELKDTVFNNEKEKKISELQTRYETENNEQQIKLQQLEIEKKEAEIDRKNLQQLAMLGVIGGAVIIILLTITGYRKIVKQRDKIKVTNEILERQKEEIKDSINYASLIQKSMQPPVEFLSANFPEYFILIKPLNILSGDFYWSTKIENQTIIAAVDCTGHGVPGAIMSMLGAALLNEIINKEYITHPGIVLRRLRKEIIKSLHQRGESGELKDGMDIALCAIDFENMKLQFAGANNPLYLIRKNEGRTIDCQNPVVSGNHTLYDIRGDRMPVSIHESMASFNLHEIDIFKGDLLYIFSDGFADQFGGPNGKKLQYRNFKRLLLDSCSESMEEQKCSLEKSLKDWQGNHNQVDDILVIGIRIV